MPRWDLDYDRSDTDYEGDTMNDTWRIHGGHEGGLTHPAGYARVIGVPRLVKPGHYEWDRYEAKLHNGEGIYLYAGTDARCCPPRLECGQVVHRY